MTPHRDSQRVSDLGEKRLIREVIGPICQWAADGRGVGDDAALVNVPNGSCLAVSTDKIPEDLLSLELGLLEPRDHGRYLAEVNLSDLAAVGAAPLGLLLTMALPHDFPVDYVREFVTGFVSGGSARGVDVLGGDTGWASAPLFSATALGAVRKGAALLRTGARPGDELAVTGQVGGFAAALAYFVAVRDGLVERVDRVHENWLQDRLTRPRARVDIGVSLAESGLCRAGIDITDGLGQTLVELGQASRVGFTVEAARLPIHAATRAVADLLELGVLELVLAIGLDLELVVVIDRMAAASFRSQEELIVIGEVIDHEGIVIDEGAGETYEVASNGWEHFATPAIDQVRRLIKTKHIDR